VKVIGNIGKWAKPFSSLLGRFKNEVSTFSYEDSGKLTRENLLAQYELVEF
jgi:hypothetical protein